MTTLMTNVESPQDNSASVGNGVENTQTQPQTQTWRDSLPEEFRNDPSLANFKDINDLAKSYVHAQKLVGKDKVVLPTSSSKPEEWGALFKKLGMPDADKYTVEGLSDDDASKKLKELFVKNNILPTQAKEIMNFLANEFTAEETDTDAEYEKAVQVGIESLKAEWGESFTPNVQRAAAVVQMFGGEEMIGYLNETGLGNDPNLIKFFAKIGSQFTEDSFRGQPAQALSKADAQARIKELYADKAGPLLNSKDPRHADALAEIEKLSAILNS